MHLKPYVKFVALILLAVLLSMTTFVFGAVPMRVARLAFGRIKYWSGFASAAAVLALAGLPAYALLMFSLVVVVGAYTDLEEHGESVFVSGLVGLAAAMGTTALCGGLWLHRTKIHLFDEIRTMISTFESGAMVGNPNFTINADSVIQQLPSIAIISLLLALGISLLGERRALAWFGFAKTPNPAQEARLSHFRIPDFFVWLSIGAVFGAFYKHGVTAVEAVSINVLNVLAVVYFYQGLAIVSQAFNAFKVTPFWRGLWYIILVLQLFLLVSLIGFADFWIEFRERLARKPAATNKSI